VTLAVARERPEAHVSSPAASRGVSALGDHAGTLSVLTWREHRLRRACGRSSMAEPQPSKLVMRVRFPSPAPTQNPRSRAVSSSRPTTVKTPCPSFVPVACPIGSWLCPSAWTRRTPPHGRSDPLIPFPSGVLVDQRGPRTLVQGEPIRTGPTRAADAVACLGWAFKLATW
jgi:hypothetical protein